jgi:hypothetical protein
MSKGSAWWLAASLLVAGGMLSRPGSACVVCGSGGECYDQPATLSGNCECSITQKNSVLVCRPKGVCDPNDAASCSTNPSTQTATKGAPVIDARFLDLVGAKAPLLAGALWGAVEEEYNQAGAVIRVHLSPGEYSGTMGSRDHRGSYTYHVFVRQLADTVFTLNAKVEEEGTGEIQEFDGALYERGAQGELARLENGKGVPVAVWDLRPGHQRDGGPGRQ